MTTPPTPSAHCDGKKFPYTGRPHLNKEMVDYAEKKLFPPAQSTLEKVREFQKIMTDFPRAWDVCKNAALREQHHENCSWRTSSMLCDCAASRAFCYCIDNYVKPYQGIAALVESQAKIVASQKKQIEELEQFVQLAATGKRRDGTYNYGREAIEQKANELLSHPHA